MQPTAKHIEIQNYLPHRKPMLMVDWILEINTTYVSTIFEIKADNVFVMNNAFTEIGLIENAAQTCSSIVGHTFFLDQDNQVKEGVEVIGFISGIRKVSIFGLPKVGSTIHAKATLSSRLDMGEYIVSTMICQTFCNEEKLLEAEINLFIQQKQ